MILGCSNLALCFYFRVHILKPQPRFCARNISSLSNKLAMHHLLRPLIFPFFLLSLFEMASAIKPTFSYCSDCTERCFSALTKCSSLSPLLTDEQPLPLLLRQSPADDDDLLHFTGQDFTAAQRERAQEDFKVPFKGAPPHPPSPFAYERQPQHRDHPTLFE